MKKRILALTLILALLLPLVGCNFVPAPTDPTTTGNPGTTPPVTSTSESKVYEYTVNIQHLPENLANPDNLPVLNWVFLASNRGINVLREDAVVEANQMLAEKNMPFRLQITHVTYTGPKVWVGNDPIPEMDLFARPETQEILANADVIHTNFDTGEMEKYLSPITEYAKGIAQPSLENAVASQVDWSQAMIGDEIFGIPTSYTQAQSVGWHVDREYWDEYGLTVEDFSRPYWEMDNLFAEIYAKNGGEPFLRIHDNYLVTPYNEAISGDGAVDSSHPGALYESVPIYYQSIGSVFAIDHSAKAPTVVNLLETDTIHKIWQAMIRYQKVGYAVRANWQEFMPIEFGATYGTEVYMDRHPIYTEYNDDICIPVGESVCREFSAGCPAVGVAAVSKQKELAISLLNLIAEDEEFRNQLCFGKEGRDYDIENGSWSRITNENGEDTTYLLTVSPLVYFSDPDLWHRPLNTHEGKTKLQTYVDNMNGVTLRDYPIVFDYTGFEEALSALERLYHNYYTGFVQHESGDNIPEMTEQRYEEMLQELRDLGCDEIRAELQRQLDEWLAENPDWQ